jgi:hypothetical protein
MSRCTKHPDTEKSILKNKRGMEYVGCAKCVAEKGSTPSNDPKPKAKKEKTPTAKVETPEPVPATRNRRAGDGGEPESKRGTIFGF